MPIDEQDLCRLAQRALEVTAFMIADPMEDGGAPDGARHSCIKIAGVGSGAHLVLSASDGFLAELASSMLGLEPDQVSVDEEGQQALLELANILGGEVVLALGGDRDAGIVLGLPELAPDETVREAAARGSSVVLDSFGERLRIAWLAG